MVIKQGTNVIIVTRCAAAYQDIDLDTPLELDMRTIDRIIEADPALGIGRSIIFLNDGTTVNVMEPVSDFIGFDFLLN